jgi:thiol:disulfide interchange protein
MKRSVYIKALIFILSVITLQNHLGWSQSLGDSEDEYFNPEPISISTEVLPATARPGEDIRVEITATIDEGWHIYSLIPSEEELIPPTDITWFDSQLIKKGPTYETNPIVEFDPVIGGVLGFHENQAHFYQNFKIPDQFPLEDYTIKGQLTYQVCNDRICLLQQKVPLITTMRLEDLPVRSEYSFANRTIDELPDSAFRLPGVDSLDNALSMGFWSFILLAMVMGALAWLTPCVFPMIPITISYFSKQAQDKRSSVVSLAIVFSLGIVISFSGLGLILTAILGAAGAVQLATSPWTNLLIAGLFSVFALSLMGLFELRLPLRLTQSVDSLSRKKSGWLSVSLMGVAFSLTAFTCTVQFVGTLLIAASQGEWLWPIIGMIVFASVFAFPFLLLALFPKWVNSFYGKSGPWMIKLKFILGLIELMAVFKFLSNADLLLGWGLFTRTSVLGFWVILLILMAVTALGWLPIKSMKSRTQRPIRFVPGFSFLLIAIYLASGVTGNKLDGWTESYLPITLDTQTVVSQNYQANIYSTSVVDDDLNWLTGIDQALEVASKEQKPVFVDFTGYTCVNCRWMEINVFTQPGIKERLENEFVLLRLFTDGGENAEQNQKLQIERFKTIALPLYIFLSPEDKVLVKTAGISSQDEFSKLLDQALKRYRLSVSKQAS